MVRGKTPARPEAPDPAPTTPDPIEIAMEAEAGDTAPDSPARRLLIRQERLIEEQIRLTRLERLGRRLARSEERRVGKECA